jgi:hypothetical protein
MQYTRRYIIWKGKILFIQNGLLINRRVFMNSDQTYMLKYATSMLDDVITGATDNDYDSLRILHNLQNFIDAAIDSLLEDDTRKIIEMKIDE